MGKSNNGGTGQFAPFGNSGGQSLGGLKYYISSANGANPVEIPNGNVTVSQGTKTGRLSSFSGLKELWTVDQIVGVMRGRPGLPPTYSNTDKKWYHAKGMTSIQERVGTRVFQVENTTQVERLEDTLNTYEERIETQDLVIKDLRAELARLKNTSLGDVFLELVSRL